MTETVKGMSRQQLKRTLKERALEKARQQEAAIVDARDAVVRRHTAEAELREAVLAERVALAVAARLLAGAPQAHEMLSDAFGSQAQKYGLEVKTIEAAQRAAEGAKVEAAVQKITDRPVEERRPRRGSTRRSDAVPGEAGGANEVSGLPPVGEGTTQEPQAGDRLGARSGWPAGGQEPS
ncbi:hypothetical protein [Streptosporangium sandarakinum]|uniref:hypothetical protein n=1 Tax=Streptosporangium sandarakinum TaxID=1260955 RepID=UPI0037A9D54C